MLTFKQIEAAYWVQALGSYHAAAEKLSTTQSAISKRIIDLEAFLGIMIFDRRSRTLLTADGRGLMADFSEMLNLRSNIIGRVQPAGLYSGFFRLGVTEMVALTWLPELIAAIKQRYPKIVLQSKVDRTRNLWQQLNTNQLDLIICPWAGEKDNMLDNAFLDSTDYAWMIHRSLLCPDKAIYSFEEIMQFPLVTHSEDSMLHGLLARLSSEKKNGAERQDLLRKPHRHRRACQGFAWRRVPAQELLRPLYRRRQPRHNPDRLSISERGVFRRLSKRQNYR
jgi:DNA-binding transcriptional LysR family regulator